MPPSVAEIDWTKLNERERETLDRIVPLVEDGFAPKEIAEKLGRGARDVQTAIEELAARVMALSGRNELPPHAPEELEALEAGLLEHGQRNPILRGSPTSARPGEIIEGNARLKILRKHGVEPWIVDVDGDADQLRSLALVLNLGRRHLSSSARRGLVRVELLRDATRSDRAIARELGVSPTTVGSIRRELEQTGTVSKLDTRTGADGVAQPAGKPAAVKPESDVRTIRVLVAGELFEQHVGPWVQCSAFRLVERRPNVYELQVHLVDATPADESQLQALEYATATLAKALGRTAIDVVFELLGNASDVFGRPIPNTRALFSEEAAWAITRMTELAEMAAR